MPATILINRQGVVDEENPLNVTLRGSEAIAHETIALGNDEPRALEQIPPLATAAFITIEGASVRYWLDGTDPTSSQGHMLEDLDMWFLQTLSQLEGFRVRRIEPANCLIQVTYFGG